MATWRPDPIEYVPRGGGADLGDLRDHAGAHVLLLLLALGCGLDVRDGAVWVADPQAPGAAPEPVPLAVLDAVEFARGWVRTTAAGVRLTRAGLWELDRWGRARYQRRAWDAMRRRFAGEVVD